MTARQIAFVFSMLLAADVLAGWKDTGVTPGAADSAPVRTPAQVPGKFRPVDDVQPRPAQTVQYRAPRGTSSVDHSVDRGAPARTATVMTISPDMYSAFLDAGTESEIWTRVSYAAGGKVKATQEKLSFLDIDTRFALCDFRNVLSGDMTIDVAPSLRFITDDGDIGHMPYTMIQLPLDIEWIWRYLNGWSFELGFTPGLYAASDTFFSGRAFGFPLRGCFYYSLSETTSVRAGIELRPGWEQVVMPLVGIAWQPTEMFRAELGVPHSLANLQIGRFGVFGEIKWRNVTYAMDDDVGTRKLKDITFNDWMLGVGASYRFTDTLRIAFEFGAITGRDITYGDVDPIDVAASSFFGVTIGSEF